MRPAERRRGDLAEKLVTAAEELSFAVHTEGAEEVARVIRRLRCDPAKDPDRARALLVVLAAMVDVDTPTETVLAWVTWDEAGRPLPPGQLEAEPDTAGAA